uniref:Uncharacterized protein n=1 Tax=Rhipicephalus zambeziensis TaxID=60191 RepID=A0A224YFM9_9ACAR
MAQAISTMWALPNAATNQALQIHQLCRFFSQEPAHQLATKRMWEMRNYMTLSPSLFISILRIQNICSIWLILPGAIIEGSEKFLQHDTNAMVISTF